MARRHGEPPGGEASALVRLSDPRAVVLDLSSLTLEHVILSHNGLEGDTNLTMLPPHLVTLAIDNNRFVGCPELTQLPPTLVSLKFGYNDFSGDVDFGSLPNE